MIDRITPPPAQETASVPGGFELEFEAPLPEPQLTPDATRDVRPYQASEKHQQALGFPERLVDNWQDTAIAKLGELLDRNRSLRVYLDACVKCGACTDKCHYYLGTGDPKNMPVARQDLLRSVYRRHFTWAGRLAPKTVGARELDESVLYDWYTYFHQCSQCRRCSLFCPFGIDTAEISMAAREVMDSIGLGQKYCNEIIGKVHNIGNNLGLPGPALENTLEGLEEDIKDDTGYDVKIPVDQQDAEVLLITPSADFFAEPHIDGLIGYAKVFHQAGLSWTLSSEASEAANFAMFIGSYEHMRKIAERIRKAILDLGVSRVVVGECGHAWRVAYNFWNTLVGVGTGGADPYARAVQSQLDPAYPVPQHICELTRDLYRAGRLRLDQEANDHMVLTFHDSCNVARASRMGNQPRGQFEIPREVLRASVRNFREMHPDTTHEKTFCCGGGGGLLTDELMDIRVKGASPRAHALQDVVEREGVTHMAAICAICKTQFAKVLPKYDLPMDMIVSLHQVVGNALRLDKGER